MRLSLAAAAFTASVLLPLSTVQAGKLIPIPPFPGAVSTSVRDINDNNIVTGFYDNADGTRHGFVGSLDGQYVTFDHPNGHTEGQGIGNDGSITGVSLVQTSDCPILGCEFVRTAAGVIKKIRKDGAVLDGIAKGIASRDKFVGDYSFRDQNNVIHTLGYLGKGAKYLSDVTLPFDTIKTRPRDLTKSGIIIGFFNDPESDQFYSGFILQNGTATAVDDPDPNAFATQFEGMYEKKGMIGGYWTDSIGTSGAGFLYKIAANAFLDIHVSGKSFTGVFGINDHGVAAVGAHDGANGDFNETPYIYCPKSTSCPLSGPEAIDVPENWHPAGNRRPVCQNACSGSWHRMGSTTKSNTAPTSDPALRIELGLRPGN